MEVLVYFSFSWGGLIRWQVIISFGGGEPDWNPNSNRVKMGKLPSFCIRTLRLIIGLWGSARFPMYSASRPARHRRRAQWMLAVAVNVCSCCESVAGGRWSRIRVWELLSLINKTGGWLLPALNRGHRPSSHFSYLAVKATIYWETLGLKTLLRFKYLALSACQLYFSCGSSGGLYKD